MTPEQFQKHIAQLQLKLDKAIKGDIPKLIGNRAVSLFTENFASEGFFGKPWQEVKRRQTKQVYYRTKSGILKQKTVTVGKGIDGKSKILVNSGNLKRSINYRTEPGKVVIYSDVEYSAVHNEGLRAGRGKGFMMPKRQFIGDSKELQQAIKEVVDNVLMC